MVVSTRPTASALAQRLAATMSTYDLLRASRRECHPLLGPLEQRRSPRSSSVAHDHRPTPTPVRRCSALTFGGPYMVVPERPQSVCSRQSPRGDERELSAETSFIHGAACTPSAPTHALRAARHRSWSGREFRSCGSGHLWSSDRATALGSRCECSSYTTSANSTIWSGSASTPKLLNVVANWSIQRGLLLNIPPWCHRVTSPRKGR